MESLRVLGVFGFFVSGIIAFFAVIAGMQEWIGLHWALSGIAAFILVAMSPLLAMIVGIAGAITAWDWPWYWAALLFLWPVALQLALGVGLVGAFGVGQLVHAMKPNASTDRIGDDQI